MLQNTGTWSHDPQSEQLLFNMGLAYPSVYEKLLDQDKKYTLSYVPHAMSAVEALPMGQRKDTWFIEGRREDPIFTTGVATGTGVGNATFTVEMSDNSLNPKDVVKFKSGVYASVLDGGTPTAGGTTYTFRLQTNSTTAAIVTTDTLAGTLVGKAWNTFENKSKTGYGGYKYPDSYTNYTSIIRRSISMDGTAMTDRTWLSDKNGEKICWFPTQYRRERDSFNWSKELKLYYGTCNVNPTTGQVMTTDLEGNYLMQGDGFRPQINGINVGSFTGQMMPDPLLDFLYAYQDNASLVNDTTVLAITGTQGAKQWQRCLELKYLTNPIMRQAIVGGKPVDLGNTYPSYRVGNVTYVLVVNPIKDDLVFNGGNVNADGFSKEANGFDLLPLAMDDSPVIMRKVKSAGGVDRSMIEAHIPGMVNPFGSTTITSSSVDAFDVELLTEEVLEVMLPKACGGYYQV